MYGLVFFVFLPVVVFCVNKDKPGDAFEKDCLDAHNSFRAEHGVAPLVWSTKLTEHAQKWADVLASKDEIKHDDDGLAKNDEGENLAFFRPAVPKCQDSMVGNCILCREMVKRWYDEAKFYNFDNGASANPDSVTKHFTQIVWSNTSEMGIGTAISKTYGFVTVARYWPPGNKGGPEMFILNVPPEGGPLPSLPSLQGAKPQPKTAASLSPTGFGLPVTTQPNKQKQKQPKAQSTVTPKPEKPASNTNATEQDPHKMVQNDDIGNTFDSHLSKDFGYEGAKMYGDVMGRNMENSLQTNRPHVKNFNSPQQNDKLQQNDNLQEQLNNMADADVQQEKKITRVGQPLVGSIEENPQEQLDNMEVNGGEQQMRKISGVGEALVGNSQSSEQKQLDVDKMEMDGNEKQAGKINKIEKVNNSQENVKISDVGKPLLENSQEFKYGSAQQITNSKHNDQLSFINSPEIPEAVEDGPNIQKIVQNGEPLLQGNFQENDKDNSKQQLSFSRPQELVSGKDMQTSNQDNANEYKMEESGISVNVGLNKFDDDSMEREGNMVDVDTGSILRIPDNGDMYNNGNNNEQKNENNGIVNKNNKFDNHNDQHNKAMTFKNNGNPAKNRFNNQNAANENVRNNGIGIQNNANPIKNGFNNQNEPNRNVGNVIQKNGKGSINNAHKNGGFNNQQKGFANGNIMENNGENNNIKNNANFGVANRQNRFNANGNIMENNGKNKMKNTMNVGIGKQNGFLNNGNVKNNGKNNPMNNKNINSGVYYQNSLTDNEFSMENEGQNFNVNNNKNNPINKQNNIPNVAKGNAINSANRMNSFASGVNSGVNYMNSKQSSLMNNSGNVEAIPEALKNRGLVRTVKGPDGTSAQVFLTKNGAHAGLVFRDYISRVRPSSRGTIKESRNNRIIYVV